MERLKFKKLDYSVKNAEGVEEIKKSEGKLPTRATAGDAGLDLYSTRMTQEVDNSGKLVLVYHTGLAVEIPDGYMGLLFMRSSVANKSLTLTNAVGVVDSGYRGELIGKFKITTDSIPTVYQEGERVMQLIVLPYSEVVPVFADELSDGDRGEKGYGSSNEPTTEPVENIAEEVE